MAAARYRDRHSVSHKKSDAGDALVLANMLRTTCTLTGHSPNDFDLGRAIAVLARAQQDRLGNRQQIANQLRSLWREDYPAALNTFAVWTNGLCRPEARELFKSATTSTRATRLTRAQLQAALKRASRRRGIRQRPTACVICSALSGPTSRRSSRMLTANRCSPSSSSWKPPAPPPTSSRRRWKRLPPAPGR